MSVYCSAACSTPPKIIPTGSTCAEEFYKEKILRFLFFDCSFANGNLSILFSPNSPTAIYTQILGGYNNGAANDPNTKIVASNKLQAVSLGDQEISEVPFTDDSIKKDFGKRELTAIDWHTFQVPGTITDPLGIAPRGEKVFWDWVKKGKFNVGVITDKNEIKYLVKPDNENEFATITINVRETEQELADKSKAIGRKITLNALSGFDLSQTILSLTPPQANGLAAFRA